MKIDPSFWKNKRVFITGHTGFKGSWLSMWLYHMGANVTGYALPPPTDPSLFEMAGVGNLVTTILGDICDYKKLETTLQEVDPEIIFHMAAQPIVLESYLDPIKTHSTNIMGTAHLLEASRKCKSLKAVVVITTDKCYRNNELGLPFVEDDPLGGYDPYSASKACAEIIASSYRDSFFNEEVSAGIATVRAGNVIGGGDFAKNRIVPDIIRAWEKNSAVTLRNPEAIRPWQEVIEPLGGYIILAQLLSSYPKDYSQAFNFGPDIEGCCKVGKLADMLCKELGIDYKTDFVLDSNKPTPHEAQLLQLNNQKAKKVLGWQPRYSLEETLEFISDFAIKSRVENDIADIKHIDTIKNMCLMRIDDYMGR